MINFSRCSISSLESLSRNSLESLEILASEIKQHYIPRTDLIVLETKIKQLEEELKSKDELTKSKGMKASDCPSPLPVECFTQTDCANVTEQSCQTNPKKKLSMDTNSICI